MQVEGMGDVPDKYRERESEGGWCVWGGGREGGGMCGGGRVVRGLE